MELADPATEFAVSGNRNEEAELPRRLALKLALELRTRPGSPVGLVGAGHVEFAVAVAWALDHLAQVEWQAPPAAERMGVTTAALVRFLAADKAVLGKVNAERAKLGRGAIRG